MASTNRSPTADAGRVTSNPSPGVLAMAQPPTIYSATPSSSGGTFNSIPMPSGFFGSNTNNSQPQSTPQYSTNSGSGSGSGFTSVGNPDIGASYFGPGSTALGSAFQSFSPSTAFTQSAQQRALASQQQQAQMQFLNAAVRNAQAGQSFLAPSAQAYTAAANAYQQAINQGLSNANGVYGNAIGASNADMASATNALNQNYGLAIGTIKDYGGQAVGRIDQGTAAAQQYLSDAYNNGANALLPYTTDASNSYGNLSNFVNGGFAGDYQNFLDSPVYTMGLKEGQKTLQNSAAARGSLQSGQTLKDLQQFGNDYANQQYFNYTNQRYQQLADLANMGYTGSATLANLANQTGQAQSGAAMQGALGGADILNQVGQASGQLYGDLGTRLGTTYEDFTGMNNQLYGQQAQAALAASQANAQAQKEGILGAGQRMYSTNYYNMQNK